MQNTFHGSKIVFVAFLTLIGAFGLNLAAGQFFVPLHDAYGWDLTTLSLAVSLNMITWGIFQPVMGRLIDRFGPKYIIAGSATLMGASFILSATITELWQFFLYYGFLAAVGFAGCGSMANSVLVSRWYVKGRAKMLARSSMGMNIGQLILLPLTGILIASASFRSAFTVLGLIMLIIVVPAVLAFVKNDPADLNQFPDGAADLQSLGAKSVSLKAALGDRQFWFATLSFSSCGFTLYLVTMHLPNFAVELGGGKSLGGQLLGIAAFASACSMWLNGQLARTVGKKRLLVMLYSIRCTAFFWLAFSTNVWQLYIFALIFGISSMPIIPLKTGIIGDKFGKNAMGSILGFSWLTHQVFAAAGVFFGGYIRTELGSYTSVYLIGAFMLVGGAILTSLLTEDSVPEQKVKVAS